MAETEGCVSSRYAIKYTPFDALVCVPVWDVSAVACYFCHEDARGAAAPPAGDYEMDFRMESPSQFYTFSLRSGRVCDVAEAVNTQRESGSGTGEGCVGSILGTVPGRHIHATRASR